MSRTLPLEVIRVAEPCKADWDAMTGDAAKRFCAGCQKHVHNLSAMPRAEAERLVCASAGSLCVRYETAADGQMVTLDYGGKPRVRGGWRLWTLVGFIGAAVAGAAQALTGARTVATTGVVMGAAPAMPMPPANVRTVMGDIGPGAAVVVPPVTCPVEQLPPNPPGLAPAGE